MGSRRLSHCRRSRILENLFPQCFVLDLRAIHAIRRAVGGNFLREYSESAMYDYANFRMLDGGSDPDLLGALWIAVTLTNERAPSL